MGLKTFTLSAALLCSLAVAAQDKIYKKDGSTVNATAVSADKKVVRYKRADNASGPEYTIPRQDVTRIEYQNGTTDNMDRGAKSDDPLARRGRHRKQEAPSHNGQNILSFIPIGYTAATDGTMNNPGLGISYERLLDDYGHISVSLPVMLNFLSDRDYDNNTFGPGSGYAVPPVAGYTSVMFMPGIKFYPAASHKTVRYAMGLSYFGIVGKEPFYNLLSSSRTVEQHSFFTYGFMFSNSLNITVMSHIFMGIEMNTGLSISDNRYVDRYDDFVPMPLVNFALKIGYRF